MTQEIKCSFGVPADKLPLDFMRLTDMEKIIGSADMLREWNQNGLKFYYMGRPVFLSCSEVNEYIRRNATIKVGQSKDAQ